MKQISNEESARETKALEFATELKSFWDDYYGLSYSSLITEAGGEQKVIREIVQDILSHKTETIKEGLQVVADEDDYMAAQAQQMLERLSNLEIQIKEKIEKKYLEYILKSTN